MRGIRPRPTPTVTDVRLHRARPAPASGPPGRPRATERAGDPPRSAADRAREAQSKELFKQQFGELAGDRDGFHAAMKKIYGAGYDEATAERLRKSALKGDYSWLPEVRFVSKETLAGANGAYDAETGVVYLNEALSPNMAASTFVEEAGHHLDTLVNATDAAGDEGELFRRVLAGEPLSDAQVAEIRAENDKGIIHVDGKAIEVEFWKPFKAIGKAFKKAAKKVGRAIKKVAEGVGKGIASAAKGIGKGVLKVGQGVVEGVGGFFKNLVRGRIADALKAVVDGADKAIFQSLQSVTEGLFDAAYHVTDATAEAIGGKVGEAFKEVAGRLVDVGHTVVSTAIGAARDFARMHVDSAISLTRGFERSLKHVFKGEFKDAGKAFGMAFVNAGTRYAGGGWDALMRTVQGVASAGATIIGREPASRRLTETERTLLADIYGDSVDLDLVRIKRGGTANLMAAHVVGNTVYMPDKYFTRDADGNHVITRSGLITLVHEAGHLWQNQNGGGAYIHQAQGAGAIAKITQGDRNRAYDWEPAADEGVPFADLNPEQQAEIPEVVARALLDDTDGQLTPEDFPGLTREQFIYVLASMEMMRPGFIDAHASSQWSSSYSPAWELHARWTGGSFPRQR